MPSNLAVNLLIIIDRYFCSQTVLLTLLAHLAIRKMQVTIMFQEIVLEAMIMFSRCKKILLNYEKSTGAECNLIECFKITQIALRTVKGI